VVYFGKVEIPRAFIMTNRNWKKFVMPAKAGIHHRSLQVANPKMDSGMRRNDGLE
jgi:hypothetical protein